MTAVADRIREIRAELQTLAGAQEEGLHALLLAAIESAQTVASDRFPGRVAVRNDAARLLLILKREAPAFRNILDKAST